MKDILYHPLQQKQLSKKYKWPKAWNTRNPELVAKAYTENSEWRNRNEFIMGRKEIIAFLTRKWQYELQYKLKKEYWAHIDNRIAVRFEYEYKRERGGGVVPMAMKIWSLQKMGLWLNDSPV